MEESILVSIKKLLGITSGYTNFDQDILMHLNTVFSILDQLGVSRPEGFLLDDDMATWADYLGNDASRFDLIKSYVYLKVRMLFDPPTGSGLIDAMNRQIDELEWRITVVHDEVREEET